MKLNVNTDALIGLTAKLEGMHRSAFPSAVRNTLNDAAFDMKRNTILKSAQQNFDVKQPSFFKKYTGVKKASGFNVNGMGATVGFLNPSDPSVRAAVEGMEKQEHGGVIDDGSRYLRFSRGGNLGRKVQKKNYYNSGNVITGRSRSGGTRKSKFVARAFRSLKEGKPFFMNTMKGNFLVRTNSISKNDGKLDIKLNFVMMSRKVVKTKLKATHFNQEASQMTVRKMDGFYRKNAQFQFKKYMKL